MILKPEKALLQREATTELYDLTPEEVAIIEHTVSPS
jgi:hypothetical protein